MSSPSLETPLSPLDREIELLAKAEHPNPHQILGLHACPAKGAVLRVFRPGAPHLLLELHQEVVGADLVDRRGLFERAVPEGCTLVDYRLYDAHGELQYDPYSFAPTFGKVDQHLFAKGVHYEIHRVMGARVCIQDSVEGTAFTVWAPNALRVSVVGDFNRWDGRVHPMRRLDESGVWELFVPGLMVGALYKFEVKTASGEVVLKADPYARQSEVRPQNASIIWDPNQYIWGDREWIQRRVAEVDRPYPMAIYEVHLGSWKKEHGQWLGYRALAHELVDYCKKMHFTHVELLPVAEHPLDESWGYQVSGYYAVTSRFGPPEEFQYLVDHLHQAGIGVIVDWVPAHFPTDRFALAQFDGTALYEHEDDRLGHHPHWDTKIFNYGRHEVVNFLIGSALYWMECMHIDGLRVDAVASMLYLDYGREEGEWIPNGHGGNENIEAMEFVKHLNSIVHQKHPGVRMIAEESTTFPGVTRSLDQGGLGFDLKWNLGWMNDTLAYFQKDPFFRKHHHNELTFGLMYAFSERFVLPLSHDEVVHGKKSLLSKMPGDTWQQFANLRLLYSYMICQPGKKLLFMGGEVGQWEEWNCKGEVHWHLLDTDYHQGMQAMVRDLNHFYQMHPALWERDHAATGFEWADFSDTDNSVLSYFRKSHSGWLLCIHNFTPQHYPHYFVRCGAVTGAHEVFNTDASQYGGSDKRTHEPEVVRDAHGEGLGLNIVLPPLATAIFEMTT